MVKPPISTMLRVTLMPVMVAMASAGRNRITLMRLPIWVRIASALAIMRMPGWKRVSRYENTDIRSNRRSNGTIQTATKVRPRTAIRLLVRYCQLVSKALAGIAMKLIELVLTAYRLRPAAQKGMERPPTKKLDVELRFSRK